ncbi:hypothetical protein BDN70DRAFT_877287 [Pholiota conissans]|uniref:Post-SET domain-containing protein n=1 Tax=Pholiota conissans TaxID=109636 RepID=A0A9P5Z4J2_9AGAR|nr:hypothetical protein BDN70DRAFT_877287 [Pholiota conissans]
MPYIAFVAKLDIPARTELTFDYHTELASKLWDERVKKKKNVKLPIPKGSIKCLCGSPDCRGFLS